MTMIHDVDVEERDQKVDRVIGLLYKTLIEAEPPIQTGIAARALMQLAAMIPMTDGEYTTSLRITPSCTRPSTHRG
jgi:hypothetical protein